MTTGLLSGLIRQHLLFCRLLRTLHRPLHIPIHTISTTILLLTRQLCLPLPHLPEDAAAVQLRSRESAVQDGRDDLESDGPPLPEAAEEVEDDQGFKDGAGEGGETSDKEEAAEEVVAGWVDAIEDYGAVGEEFANNVEGT